MTLILRQSTTTDIRMGPFVDATDGVTPETSVTTAAADQAEVLKANGAATAVMVGAFAAVTGADGWYDYTLTTTDTNTIGELVVVIQDADVCLPVFVRGYVVEEAVYDDLYAASADPFTVMQSDAAAVESELIVVHSETTVIQTDTNNIYSDTTHIHSDTTAIETQTASASSDLAAIESELILTHSETTAIQTDTGNIYSDTTHLHSDSIIIESSVQAVEVDTGNIYSDTTQIHSDTLVIESDTTAIEDAHVLFSGTADSGTNATLVDAALTEADDYWNGDRVVFTNGTLDGQVREITNFDAVSNTITFAPVTTVAVATHTYKIIPGVLQHSNLEAIESELIVVHSDTTAIETATSSAASDLAAIESELILTHSETTVIQGSQFVVLEDFGSDIYSHLVVTDAVVDTIYSDTTAIETATASAASDLAAIESELIVVHSDTTAIHSQTTVMESDSIAMEAVITGTLTLPGQTAPPLTPTLEQALTWLYKVMRNRNDQTATLWQLYADNETTVDAKATVSDDGTTAVKQEIVAGP